VAPIIPVCVQCIPTYGQISTANLY